MPLARNIFVGGLDTSTAPTALPANKYTSARNIQVGRGAVETAWGNTLLAEPDFLDGGTARAVGTASDPVTGKVYVLIWHSAGSHCIAALDPATGTYTQLLRWSGLNPPATPTKNVALLDGLLVFLDASGELREFPVDKAATYTDALLAADPLGLHVVKQPPFATPTGLRMANTTVGDPRVGVNRVAPFAWQFALQYEYADGYRTPLGPYSAIIPLRTQTTQTTLNDPENFIRLTLGLSGAFTPSPLVRAVRVLTRQGDSPNWQVAQELTRTVAGFPATVDFYGDTTGEVLPTADVAKSYEAVPIRAGAIGLAQSRIFVGDCDDDHQAPAPVLTAVVRTSSSAATDTITIYKTDTVYEYTFVGGDGVDRQDYATRTAYYSVASGEYPEPDSTYYPMTEQSGVYRRSTTAVPVAYPTVFVDFAADETPMYDRTVTVLPDQPLADAAAPLPQGQVQTLHESTAYRVGIQFYDAIGRHPGASSVVDVLVPAQNYASPVAQNVVWSLPTPAAGQNTEIPAWATSYSLLLSANRTTSYFLQFIPDNIAQYRGDNPTSGEAILELYSANGAGFAQQVWIPLTTLQQGGRGYKLQAGDRIRFPQLPGQDYEILQERANYLAISAQAVFYIRQYMTGKTVLPIVEIYRPAVATTNHPLYERGPRYPVVRTVTDGVESRRYSVTSGVLDGDSFLLTDLKLEAMNPTFRQYGQWLGADRGRATIALPNSEQVRRKALVRWSGVKVAGTKLNGLSVWDSESQHDCPLEQGAVKALLLAAQTQAEGNILLAVQEAGAESLYLGQAPLQLAASGQIQAVSDRVVGGSNDLRGGFGTRHPASVTGYQGRGWWWDAFNAEVVRYAQNGATPLASKYQATSRCKELARDYAGATVHGAYDPANEQYLLFFGAVGEKPAVTLVWSEKYECFADLWDLPAELGTDGLDTLLCFDQGKPWLHTKEAPRLNFFGEAVTATITTCINEGSEYSKTWKQHAHISTHPWQVAVTNELGQASRILPAWLVREQGIYRAAFRRDENSRVPKGLLPLISGDELVSTTLTLTLTYAGTGIARLASVDTGFSTNPGQEPPA